MAQVSAVLRIGNVDPKATRDILFNTFSMFGDVLDVVFPIVEEDVESFVFVVFEDAEDCEHARLNMDGAELFGKVINVRRSDEASALSIKQPDKPVWEMEDIPEKTL